MSSLGIFVNPSSKFRTLGDLRKLCKCQYLSEETLSPLRQTFFLGGRPLMCMHMCVYVCGFVCLMVYESNKSVI